MNAERTTPERLEAENILLDRIIHHLEVYEEHVGQFNLGSDGARRHLASHLYGNLFPSAELVELMVAAEGFDAEAVRQMTRMFRRSVKGKESHSWRTGMDRT